MSKTKRRLHFGLKLISRVLSYGIAGSLVVVIIVFATWKIYQVFSPSTDGSIGQTQIFLKSSDHYRNLNNIVPLPNSLTDNTAPNYENDPTPTPLSKQGNNIRLFRIQGDLIYR